ncbi:LANO_0B02498g1_1 [Lachancea nothofagi CBS 11611]|uniref:LANO_0B02498g1_1 n=1 Tax=Lachancea nothofagi CBS 11611 TaxID=1266666 RepID=A0A1G4IWN3_9SACH|nr:LANO_0B02498g1_1 [Lachancea nothofagi CBS 11611]
MTLDAAEHPLQDIPVPFQYQLRESNNELVADKDMDLLLSNEVNQSNKKRKGDSERDICFGHKRFRNNGKTCPDEELVRTPSVEPSLKFSLGEEDNVARDPNSQLPSQSLGGNATDVSPVSVAPATINNNSTLAAAQSEDGLPLSPVASPSNTSSAEDLYTLHKTMSKQEYLNTVAATAHAQLSPPAYRNLVFQLISKLNRSELSDLGTLVKDNLKRDFISSLPLEVAMNILTNLKFEDISRCLAVNKTWNSLIKNTPYLWRKLMVSEGFLSLEEFRKQCQEMPSVLQTDPRAEDAVREKFLLNQAYLNNCYSGTFKPHRTTLRGHSVKIVTCLQFEDDYVITGADDKVIRVYDAKNERFITQLSGHDGGVWALKYGQDGILVSGSTDRSVRVWNIKNGKCTHVFKGHTSTVRCLDIVEHNGEKFIITGSRDHTLHVWKLPNCHGPNYNPEVCEVFSTTDSNPYFVGILRGHMAAVRTVSGHGNIVISGSYDFNLMVWDIAQMKCLYVLTGHTDRIYSTIYDYERHRCISAGMDSTVKVWNLEDVQKNGHCSTISSSNSACIKVTGSMLTLQGHTALVGLLGLSDKYLVSAGADGVLRGWDSKTYSRQFAYQSKDLSAITTFYANDNLLVSGSEGQFNVYNLRSGKPIHSDLLSDADQVWSVKFNNRKFVAAIERDGHSYVEFLDFGRPKKQTEAIQNSEVSQNSASGSNPARFMGEEL